MGLSYKNLERKNKKLKKLLHDRNRFELWVDKYNHTLEFTRTVVQILVFILQIIILWRIFN
jgi:hypothetical protein